MKTNSIESIGNLCNSIYGKNKNFYSICHPKKNYGISVRGSILFNYLVFTSLIVLFGCSNQNGSKKLKTNAVFQYSTLSALLEGVYDGEMTVGELVLFEGECYKVTSDSKVNKTSDSQKIPFAAICTFVPDTIFHINRTMNLNRLENYIDSVADKTNLIYAYKISGRFDTIVIRSVPKQKKPYQRLIDAYKKQGIYNFTHQEGMIFGYKFPEYLKDVNMDNYHLHFLSSDKSKGGHLLNCTLSDGEVSVAYIRKFTLQLPDNKYFNNTILTNKKSELIQIEGARK